MSHTIAVILGGGKGTRLYPLTAYRTKPAVPIGGKYRLIDISVSNCINSNVRQMYILTQFNSHSLHSHVHATYKFDIFSQSFVKILAAELSPDNSDWYQGTADAVRKNIVHLEAATKPDDLILILSGDQLYKMNFKDIIAYHREHNADLTVAVNSVNAGTAKDCGVLRTNPQGRITAFTEKPKTPEELQPFANDNNEYLASMGIYLFTRDLLFDILHSCTEDDFGRGILPYAISHHSAHAYLFKGYWEDIGSISSFYRASVGIACGELPFNFNNIYTHPRFLQPTSIQNTQIISSMISDGCILNSGVIEKSLIGLRCRIGNACDIRESVLMGSDFYEETPSSQLPLLGLGNNVRLFKTIVDKNARIGNNVSITNTRQLTHADGPHYVIRDGIVIIPKGAIVPDNSII